MKHLRNVAFALAAIICGSITTASAEKWSCERTVKGKVYKHEFIVSGDKMFVPGAEGSFRVELNDKDTLLAFAKFFAGADSAKDQQASSTVYFVIAKSTGVALDIQDHVTGVDYGTRPEQWAPPLVTVEHCSLEQP